MRSEIKQSRRKRCGSGMCVVERMESRTMLSAGNLDSTFGDGGVVQLDGTQVVQMDTSCSALQSDGKILLGGASINGGGDGVFSEIARLNRLWWLLSATGKALKNSIWLSHASRLAAWSTHHLVATGG
jgi:hypothetical protein